MYGMELAWFGVQLLPYNLVSQDVKGQINKIIVAVIKN